MKKFFKTRLHWYFTILALCIGINWLFGIFPNLCFRGYTNGVFQVIRVLYDYTLGLLPFPMVYLVFALLMYLLFRFVKLLLNGKFLKAIIGLIKTLMIAFISFYVLWGYNYQSPSLRKVLNLESTSLDKQYIIDELKLTNEEMLQVRSSDYIFPSNCEADLREIQEKILASWGYSTSGRVRIRRLSPNGTLLRISTAGVYIPFAMEGHIDRGLHSLQWPSTMAHEMAHGYGITDEGTCNFIGLITCLNSNNADVQYSGWMMYLRYLLAHVRTYYPEDYKIQLDNIAPEIIEDIRSISKQLDVYPSIFPAARDVIYNQYLKHHGIEEGIKNYGSIISIVKDYKESKRSNIHSN